MTDTAGSVIDANGLRVLRQKANAARGITPKRTHDGYIVLGSRQVDETYYAAIPDPGYEERSREWLLANGRIRTLRMTKKIWKSSLQTPFPTDLAWHIVKYHIISDLNDTVLPDLGCGAIQEMDLSDAMAKKDEANFVFRINFFQNIKAGYWEVDLFTFDPPTIPAQRLPPKSTPSNK